MHGWCLIYGKRLNGVYYCHYCYKKLGVVEVLVQPQGGKKVFRGCHRWLLGKGCPGAVLQELGLCQAEKGQCHSYRGRGGLLVAPGGLCLPPLP